MGIMVEIGLCKKAGLFRRIIAAIIDVLVVVLILCIPFMFHIECMVYHENHMAIFIKGSILVGLIMLMFKDFYNGKSIGKWVMDIAVLDNSVLSNKPSKLKLIIRNILVFIWPIELFMTIFSKDKRKIGDKVVGTDVFIIEKNVSALKIVTLIIVVFAISVFYMFIYSLQVIKVSRAYEVSTEYIQTNSDVLKETGGIRGYGFFTGGDINYYDDKSSARFNIKVKGNKKNINVHIKLTKEKFEDWKVNAFLVK